MPTSKILLRLQSIVADRRMRWAHDPQLWIELFVTTNLAILAADIYIAHSVNHFRKTAEYIPLYFHRGAGGPRCHDCSSMDRERHSAVA